LQVYRVMGFGSYKTAWYMCHRVRAALMNEEFRKLIGVVEVDETFIGGKDKNRHVNDRRDGRGGNNKFVVLGAVERKGNVVARVIERPTSAIIGHFLRETVSTKVSLLATDTASYYRDLPYGYVNHGRVDHSAKQYVVGAIHANAIEGFWSILKRGVVGTYHKVTKRYLPRCVAEFQFRTITGRTWTFRGKRSRDANIKSTRFINPSISPPNYQAAGREH
jgi:hypothetical protein